MKRPLNCIIVDDEPKACSQLAELIEELYDNIHIAGVYTGWKDAYTILQIQEIDIALVDIQMPGKSGIAMLKLIPDLKAEVIFVTADPTHAIEAYSLHASGYILKPLEEEVFKRQFDSAIERVLNKHAVSDLARQSVLHTAKIGVPNEQGIDYLNVGDIIYFEAFARYTKIKAYSKEVISSYSIGKFSSILQHDSFLQVHRSYIINLLYVEQYKKNGVVIMSDKKEVPVAKDMKAHFLQLFNKISK